MPNYGVTDEIRKEVKKRLIDLGLTQTELAEKLGVPRTSISRALSSTHSKRQQVPDIWKKILDQTGLELTVKEKSF